MPWEHDGWRPLEKSGKQKTPNNIRGELQRYIDACRAGKIHFLLSVISCVLCDLYTLILHLQDGSMTQTAIIEKMEVNPYSFRKFMNPKTYKDQWSATQ